MGLILIERPGIDAAFHDLPIHSGDHPRYTTMVRRDAKDMSTKLQAAIDKDKDHKKWNPPGDVKSTLLSLENKYWDFLSQRAGQVAVSSISQIPSALAPKTLGKG